MTTYEQKLQAEAEKMCRLISAIMNKQDQCGEWENLDVEQRNEVVQNMLPLAAQKLEDMAEAYRSGHKQGSDDEYNRENSTRLFVQKPLEEYLQSLGYIKP